MIPWNTYTTTKMRSPGYYVHEYWEDFYQWYLDATMFYDKYHYFVNLGPYELIDSAISFYSHTVADIPFRIFASYLRGDLQSEIEDIVNSPRFLLAAVRNDPTTESKTLVYQLFEEVQHRHNVRRNVFLLYNLITFNNIGFHEETNFGQFVVFENYYEEDLLEGIFFLNTYDHYVLTTTYALLLG